MLSRKGSRRKPRGSNGSYWMSYSDMMAALLLMFVLLLFLSFNRYMGLQETKEAELAAKEALLEEQGTELEEARKAVADQANELISIRTQISSQQLQMDQQQMELDEKSQALDTTRALLEEQESLIAASQTEIDDARERLAEAEEAMQDRETLLDDKNEELLEEQQRVASLETLLNEQKDLLDEQAARLDELVGVRPRIIKQLRDAFAGEGLNVGVDQQTGAITLEAAVLFDTDQSYVMFEGAEILDTLLPVYCRTLMLPENIDFVGEIVVEGHTDSVGTYQHNLDLSQRRAQAVVNYCMSEEFTGLTVQEKEVLQKIISASGRSWSQPVLDEFGVEDRVASRRVEIKFRLKDAEMIDSINRILSEMDTGTEESTAQDEHADLP